jgi:hypothetical protein
VDNRQKKRLEDHRDFLRREKQKKIDRAKMVEHCNGVQKTKFGQVNYPMDEGELL